MVLTRKYYYKNLPCGFSHGRRSAGTAEEVREASDEGSEGHS